MSFVHGRPIPPRPDPNRQRRALERAGAWAGRLPAEVLSTEDREQLVVELWAAGWTDVEVASHCRMSTYTAARIRERLELEPNPQTREGAA